MSELLWDDVKDLFDLEWEGCLPDVWVTGTTVRDWQAVLDLIAVSDWRSEYSEGDAVMPTPRAASMIGAGRFTMPATPLRMMGSIE